MITIRQAVREDAAAIAFLHAKSWRMAYTGILSDHYLLNELEHDRQTDWQGRFLQPAEKQYVIVAEDDAHPGIIMGFACAYGKFDPEVGTLVENLHAHPEHKKSGIGKRLLQNVAQWSLRHYPDDFIHLWVLTQNKAAIGFYEHMGAKEDLQSVWDAPGGTRVPELRYTWYEPQLLV